MKVTFGKKSSFAKKSYKARKPYKKMSSKKKSSFAKKVLSIVHKNVETKQAYASVQAIAFNSGINSAGDLQWLIPNIVQGTADNSRIGDQIRGQTISIKGLINTNLTYNTQSNCRLGVRVMIVTPKQFNQLSDAQSNYSIWTSNLLKKGGTTSAFTGAVNDLWAPINTDMITSYYDKVYYVTTPYAITAAGAVDIYKSNKFFNIKLRLKNKLLRYDNSVNSGLTPINFAPIMLIGYAHLDGSGPDTVTTQIASSFDVIFDYEDA